VYGTWLSNGWAAPGDREKCERSAVEFTLLFGGSGKFARACWMDDRLIAVGSLSDRRPVTGK
jgi:hypothetical protein